MKKFILSLFAMISFVFLAQAQSDNFVLITTLYNEKIEARYAEFIVCMEKNLAHPCIDTIHVLYDTSKDDNQKSVLLDYLRSQPVVIDYIQGRPTFDDCFKIANQLYPDRRVIVSNADIYYNETLSLLDNYDLTDKFLALTRWNVEKDGSITMFYHANDQQRPATGSFDTWIFKTPIRSFEDKNIQIGTAACDGRIAYEARQSGLTVINPYLSIQCCHVHLSGIRNWYSLGFMRGEVIVVPWSTLT